MSSFFLMNRALRTNRKWNYQKVSVLHVISVSCSQTIFFLLFIFFTFFSSEIISLSNLCFYFILFYFVLFLFFLVTFLLNNWINHLLSFFIWNCSIHTNRKWNCDHVSVLPFIFVNCSQTIEEEGRHSLPLKWLFYFI